MACTTTTSPRSRPRPPTPPRRSRALLITVGLLVVLFLAFTGFSAFWTERLWFSSVGYQEVFTTLVRTKIGLFAVFGIVMALAVGANLLLAYRFRPIFRPPSPEQASLDRYREAVTPDPAPAAGRRLRGHRPLRRRLRVGQVARVPALAQRRATSARSDPYFGRDIGFYVFDLPWLHYLVDFAMAVTVISLLAAAVVHYLYGGIRLQSQQDRFSGPAAAQLSVLIGHLRAGQGRRLLARPVRPAQRVRVR